MFYNNVTANLDVLSALRFSILKHNYFCVVYRKFNSGLVCCFPFLFLNIILVDVHGVISGYAKLILECNNVLNY